MLARTTLANGIRVLTESMPEARSVTSAIWAGVGGRDEREDDSGASHFLEHLLFKGTEARSARQIAESVDAVGGEMNAFTAREHTAYYLRIPHREVRFGLELLCDVVAAPALRPHELAAEREVILEELLAADDNPEDVVHRTLAEAMYPDHPLGREVLGTPATISAMDRDDIARFLAAHYRPANLVVAAAGRLDHDEVVALVEGLLPDGAEGGEPVRVAPSAPPAPEVVTRRPTEQAHLALGWRAFDQSDPDRFALAVLNQVLGGGLSSRLFQEVREERGLVYAVYSFASLYSDTGVLAVYAGTGPQKVDEVRAVIDGELEKLVANGVTERELEVAAGYLEGSFLLGLEDSGSRMARIGKAEVSGREVLEVDEYATRLRAVTTADVTRVIERVLTGPRTLAAVGPFDSL